MRTRIWIRLALLVAGLPCQQVAAQTQQAQAEAPEAQQTFASVAEATNALLQAVKAHDTGEVRRIFGPEVTNLMTGDVKQDEANFDSFARHLAEGCSAVQDGAGKFTLQIGAPPWPFPIPLVQSNSVWMFDTAAGEEEIINRHIGKDEFYAIGACHAYVRAQQNYASRNDGVYARRFLSEPGKSDGLCAAVGGFPNNFDDACVESRSSSNRPKPFHGYWFKILTRQGPAASGGPMHYIHRGRMTGGFALVAFPVRWGESGVMTFIVNQDGRIYERSLGEKTARIGFAMKEFNPGPAWNLVQDPGITDLGNP